MKRTAVLHFGIRPDDREFWQTALERRAPKASWFEPLTERGRPQVFCRVNMDAAAYRELHELFAERSIDWFERVEHHYTDAELRSAPLLVIGADLAPINTGSASEPSYDLSRACPRCGTGAIQSSPLNLP